jgi:hypothetical protein
MPFEPSVILASLFAVVRVSGAGTCPSPEDVAQRLATLRPAETSSAYRALIDSSGPEVIIELRDTAGATLARKTLKANTPCADLAQASAVVVATWAEQVRFTELPGPALPALLQPIPQPPEPKGSGLTWEVGVAATFAGPHFTPGALLDIRLGSLSSAWGVGLSLTFSGSTALPLGTGTVDYSPLAARLGPRFSLGLGPLVLELGAELVCGVYLLDGEGFQPDQSAHGGRGGAGLEARLGWLIGPVKLWLGVLGTGWLQKTRAAVRGSDVTTDLSRFELSGVLGLSFAP